MSVPAERQILTPAQLNALARDLLEGSFPMVWVEAEISNFSRPASGHLYFTLKDARAQIRCALFRPKSQWLKFTPADGLRVVARGRLTLYEARGEYQLVLDHMELAGEGALRRAFDELKARLAAEGLFDSARKRALPRFPRRIGVLTSPRGAAVRDVLSVLARRYPLVEVDVLPVPVQGDGAATQVVAMLQRAFAAQRYDVLLLTRGGGSLEDLWAFNDETLVRTLVAAPLPVVCAIGHEVDFALAEFAADLRAATPSAAAELLVPQRTELHAVVARLHARLDAVHTRRLAALSQRADHAFLRLRALRPHARLERGRARLDALARRLQAAPMQPLRRYRERLTHLWQRRQTAIARRLERPALRLAGLARALEAVSPLATLGRGYAILLDADSGRVIQRVADATPNQKINARLSDGMLPLRVDTTERG